MFNFLFFIIIVCFFIVSLCTPNTSTKNSISNLFISVLKNKQFSNIHKTYIDSNIVIYQADNDGENFIFLLKNNSMPLSLKDIEFFYEKAVKFHIHNKVVVTSLINDSSPIYKKIREYEIDIWDTNKLQNLSKSKNNSISSSSILKTSDTSNDTCKIDPYQNNPIQNGKSNTHSLLSIFGNKPDRL